MFIETGQILQLLAVGFTVAVFNYPLIWEMRRETREKLKEYRAEMGEFKAEMKELKIDFKTEMRHINRGLDNTNKRLDQLYSELISLRKGE